MGGRARYRCFVSLASIGILEAACGRAEGFFPAGGSGSTTGDQVGGTSGGLIGGGPGTSGASSSSTGGEVVPSVTTLAGNGTPSSAAQASFADGSGGPGGQAEFSGPLGVAVDSSGNVFVGDSLNYRVRRIDPSGSVTTLAGNGISGDQDGTGGPNGTAEFNFPSGLAVDARGNVFVADANNNRIARIDSQSNVTTLETRGAVLYVPSGVAIDRADNLFVTDTNHNRVVEIDQAGNVTIIAGNGKSGFVDGTGGPQGAAEFSRPTGVAIDTVGNLYVTDFTGCRIRKIDLDRNVTTMAGNGVQGFADGTGGPHGVAEFDAPVGIAVDQGGNLFIGDAANNRVRRIDQNGNVTTLAGNGIQGFADGALGALGNAEFHDPAGIAVDLLENVYVADSQNNRIRKIIQ